MPCHRTPFGFVCTGREPRKRCRHCGRWADPARLCDYPMPARKSKTCDAVMCLGCATQVGPDKDICPDHLAQYREEEKRGRSEA